MHSLGNQTWDFEVIPYTSDTPLTPCRSALDNLKPLGLRSLSSEAAGVTQPVLTSNFSSGAVAPEGLAAAFYSACSPIENAIDYGVLTASVQAIDSLHSLTGLPWWATLSATAVCLRTITLPVSLQGMRASSSVVPLWKEAKQQLAAEAALAAGAQPHARHEQHQQQDQRGSIDDVGGSQRAGERATPPSPPILRDMLLRFQHLRAAEGVPHPLWILASPLIQLPLFITAMASVRAMSRSGWPGLCEGGALWFQDLTAAAVNLVDLTTPMGESVIADWRCDLVVWGHEWWT
jgi:membrane protein insertase Oxa1/YidC/SpoIIIJ